MKNGDGRGLLVVVMAAGLVMGRGMEAFVRKSVLFNPAFYVTRDSRFRGAFAGTTMLLIMGWTLLQRPYE